MAEWEIHKPLGQCSGSGQAIDFGNEYVGALVETEEGLARRDYHLDFWDREKPTVFCYWRTKLPHPEQKKKVFVDDGMLMAFFDRLAGEEAPDRLNFRFVLALILMRKRRLKYDGTTVQGDREVWRLKVTGEQRMVEVTNPHLGEEEIEQLSAQIGEVLNADL
jgi:hypothetical protein